jgi:hypothetical protein
VNAYLDDKSYRRLFELNPPYCFVEIDRALVLDHGPISHHLVLIAAVFDVRRRSRGFHLVPSRRGLPRCAVTFDPPDRASSTTCT